MTLSQVDIEFPLLFFIAFMMKCLCDVPITVDCFNKTVKTAFIYQLRTTFCVIFLNIISKNTLMDVMNLLKCTVDRCVYGRT